VESDTRGAPDDQRVLLRRSSHIRQSNGRAILHSPRLGEVRATARQKLTVLARPEPRMSGAQTRGFRGVMSRGVLARLTCAARRAYPRGRSRTVHNLVIGTETGAGYLADAATFSWSYWK
jgi:hypothetical protein